MAILPLPAFYRAFAHNHRGKFTARYILANTRSNNSSSTTPQPLRDRKVKQKRPILEVQSFVDVVQSRVIGGNGGDGMLHFLALPFVPFAGPDGGDGGNGGHVILVANRQCRDLSAIGKLVRGEDGKNGRKKHQHGAGGEHTLVPVPIGTAVKCVERDEENAAPRKRFEADLDVDGARFNIARGGVGGKGNAFFLTNQNRAPLVRELGAPGEDREWLIEMKSIANVGLVGFPNAGKSSLLQSISRAQPKVASYAFTTLHPHIGFVMFNDYRSLSVADIPGIIEDAHLNRGLGIEFLRHVQRCDCLLYVLDPVGREPAWRQLQLLREEVKQYDAALLRKRSLVALNKNDLDDSSDALRQLELRQSEEFPDFELIAGGVSAVCGTNMRVMLSKMRRNVDESMREREEAAAAQRPKPDLVI